MKLKKILMFVLAGVMIVSIPVMAGTGEKSVLVVHAENTSESEDSTEGSGSGSGGGSSTPSPSTPSSSSSASSKPVVVPTRDPEPVKSEAELEAERIAAQVAAETVRESEAFTAVVEAAGVPVSVYVQALGENKSAGEYMNNAVTEVPGLAEATPVGQGGKVIIDGVPTNNTFSVLKPLLAHVQSAQSAGLGGDILNVVNIKGTASFETATVNFYMPGVTAEQNVQVYQLTDGTWNSVNVSEVREDHVVIDMTSYGIFAFVEVPVQ